MIKIYTSPSCSSCRKAKKWMNTYGIGYVEKNIFNISLTKDDIYNILANTENGFEDIISTRSKIVKELDFDLKDLTVRELTDFIIDNPSILRRPIMINEQSMQVGYNDEEIRVFLPKNIRRELMATRKF